MLETKDDTATVTQADQSNIDVCQEPLRPSQIETDSLLAWRLQAEECKRVYQIDMPAQKSTLPSYEFQSPQGEVMLFTLKQTAGDGDCFFHAVGRTAFTRESLVQKLLQNPTETVRRAFGYEIRQFLYLGASVPHSNSQENQACQQLLTPNIRNLFHTLQDAEEKLSVKVDKARSALGEKETHEKHPTALLALLCEKRSPLASEFEKAYQAVLKADNAIYQYCCQEDIFRLYVEFYLKEARGYIPFSRDFSGERYITTIDAINELFGLKIQVYLPINRSRIQLQLANQLQTGEMISIFHNGINHFWGLEKQKPLFEPASQLPIIDKTTRETPQSDLKQYFKDMVAGGIDKEAVSPEKSNLQVEQNNSPVFVHFNNENTVEPKKLTVNPTQNASDLKSMGLIEAIKQNNDLEFFRLLNLKTDLFGKKVIGEVDTKTGGNALHVAAAYGHLHFIAPLIEAGINVNQPDNDGWTPVYIAADNGHANIITALKAVDADVDMPNGDGITPIYVAVENEHAAAITALGAAGANMDALNSDGFAPICMAAQIGDATTMTALLEAGANASLKTPQGTPLEQAKKGTEPGCPEVVRLLEAHLQQYPNGIKTARRTNKEVGFLAKSSPQTEQKNPPATTQSYQNNLASSLSDLNPQANPVSSVALSTNAVVKRRESNTINLADKKEEKEKTRAVLEELRTLFLEERDEGEKTENYAIYNEYLKKANNNVQLVYSLKQNKHILYVNDEPLDAKAAVKEISKMIKSETDPITAIEQIYRIAKTIYDQAQLVKANKIQFGRLVERIQVVEAAVRRLEQAKDKKQYEPGINHFLYTLTECLDFVKKFSTANRWQSWLLKAGNHKEAFEALNNDLQKSLHQLTLGLPAQQVVNREADKEDQAKDTAFIKANQALIIDSTLQKLTTLQSANLQAKEQAEVLRLQMAAIQSQLKCITAAKPMKALVDEKHRIPYYDLVFERLLGAGSFGKIYLGEWEGQKVAIKTLEGNLSLKEQDQFIREVEIMSRLRHPNITSFYGACLEEGHACLVMEYMENASLDNFLNSKSIPVDKQLSFALDIAKGLAYLHKKHVIHRDFKSANILVNAAGIPKLADFGLSKIDAVSVRTFVERSHAVAWLAPECFKFKFEYTESSDIYSFGVTLWEIATGQKPVIDENRLSDYVSIGPRQAIPKDIHPVMQTLIQSCWSLEPSKRPDAKTLIDQLQAASVLLSPHQYYEQGQKFEKQKDFLQAFQCYQKSAESGYLKARTQVGLLYLTAPNKAVPQDKPKAFEYLLQSANEGHTRAMFNVAMMLEYGDGVSQNTSEALVWYKKVLDLEPKNTEAARKCEKLKAFASTKNYQLHSHFG
jgi:ankyrin repeat protein